MYHNTMIVILLDTNSPSGGNLQNTEKAEDREKLLGKHDFFWQLMTCFLLDHYYHESSGIP